MSDEKKPGLTLPQRRAIACVGIIVYLFAYIVLIIGLSGRAEGGKITALIFYGLAGTLWGLPLLPLIAWSENYKGKRK